MTPNDLEEATMTHYARGQGGYKHARWMDGDAPTVRAANAHTKIDPPRGAVPQSDDDDATGGMTPDVASKVQEAIDKLTASHDAHSAAIDALTGLLHPAYGLTVPRAAVPVDASLFKTTTTPRSST